MAATWWRVLVCSLGKTSCSGPLELPLLPWKASAPAVRSLSISAALLKQKKKFDLYPDGIPSWANYDGNRKCIDGRVEPVKLASSIVLACTLRNYMQFLLVVTLYLLWVVWWPLPILGRAWSSTSRGGKVSKDSVFFDKLKKACPFSQDLNKMCICIRDGYSRTLCISTTGIQILVNIQGTKAIN